MAEHLEGGSPIAGPALSSWKAALSLPLYSQGARTRSWVSWPQLSRGRATDKVHCSPLPFREVPEMETQASQGRLTGSPCTGFCTGFCIVPGPCQGYRGKEAPGEYLAMLDTIGSGCHRRGPERLTCSALVHTGYENGLAGALQQEPHMKWAGHGCSQHSVSLLGGRHLSLSAALHL